ncbi:MAG: HlyD family type I secretion periplasmic adaptor subunit [Alphaproteobacteria bacterium]|nr:HlyD family type I secretion periplasmic adaptor subunit [Alphaproteobacteria bacterium]MBU1561118.1 HlyD family type I secretion periplasmic adaptor subunit [Alphaproteobacteria bacterium]MBU2301866.1 HlyD family type I secretion periplasmic adaptor subunit [Alphaproteobacteria bacterium]MBU2368726.1 HlyD family type I secretion periplasmic adaptor subunit [Alphaproteobacteria bacterium]
MSASAELQNLEWYSGVPRSIRKQTLFGFMLVAAAFGGFGGWAAMAPLSAAVIAPGSFVATGENKIIQHFEGGIIKDLMVREGDQVGAGQSLLLLDETAAHASAQQLQLRLVRLETIWARLSAEANGATEYVAPPTVLAHVDNPEVALINESQRTNFNAARDKLVNETALMQQNVAALEFRIEGRQAQIESMNRQLALLREDYRVMVDLQGKGVAAQSSVRTIERSIADAEGDVARLDFEVREADAQIEKYRREIIQATDAVQQAALDEMQSVEAELDALREQLQQANNVLARTTVSAPVAGTIVRMYYHTTGGVIESGKPIFEILPANVPLIVEVKIPRMQIDEVSQGQPATVRLTALNQRTTPILDGEVIYVSADTIADAADMNQEVYVARVSIAPAQLARVDGFTPTPGMPAEVFVQTRERTFLEYLIKPVTDSMSRAFHEQ